MKDWLDCQQKWFEWGGGKCFCVGKFFVYRLPQAQISRENFFRALPLFWGILKILFCHGDQNFDELCDMKYQMSISVKVHKIFFECVSLCVFVSFFFPQFRFSRRSKCASLDSNSVSCRGKFWMELTKMDQNNLSQNILEKNLFFSYELLKF